MNNLKTVELNQLFHEFNICTQLQYNGQLTINNLDGKQWTFYYCLGKIVWATGGTHPSRRFRRNVTQFCSQIDIDNLQLFSENTLLDYWDYFSLKKLYQTQKIDSKQVNAIVSSTISELLFDLAQETDFQSLSYDYSEEIILGAIMTSTLANTFLQQTQESCESWLKSGLEGLSPNLAPVIIKPKIIQQKVSADVYKNLENLINGQHTLYDLSVKMKQNVLSVSRSLLPYIEKGIVALVEVPDLPLGKAKIPNNYSSISTKKNSNIPTIACVDDNLQVCQMLETIITANGMKFIKIENTLEALPILIQHQPDLIFLDLIMPGINGYELCANLRRTSVFAKTPIAILTATHDTFDKVRSKVFGVMDFINKPVAKDKVMEVVDKYVIFPQKTANLSNLSYIR
ncbi:PleD family two-component system response regulator [Dolichospermum sp. UHCC 0259]|uniref:response regulator n=1 Tax=Dolichospermum sp. UHCC 0259 TaxID=2590010 RepID=UPI0014456DA2|nr:response regulator [Dolichospermum sp. UHCC 0259]MTJ49624.1 response regulator [Dolichospermum sp. UHCC 0259]